MSCRSTYKMITISDEDYKRCNMVGPKTFYIRYPPGFKEKVTDISKMTTRSQKKKMSDEEIARFYANFENLNNKAYGTVKPKKQTKK